MSLDKCVGVYEMEMGRGEVLLVEGTACAKA